MITITVYIIGCLLNCVLMKMVDMFYKSTQAQKEELDVNMLIIVMAMSFVGTPIIFKSFENEIKWTWNNFNRK